MRAKIQHIAHLNSPTLLMGISPVALGGYSTPNLERFQALNFASSTQHCDSQHIARRNFVLLAQASQKNITEYHRALFVRYQTLIARTNFRASPRLERRAGNYAPARRSFFASGKRETQSSWCRASDRPKFQNLGAELDPQRIGVRSMGQTKRVSRQDTAPYRAVLPKARPTFQNTFNVSSNTSSAPAARQNIISLSERGTISSSSVRVAS